MHDRVQHLRLLQHHMDRARQPDQQRGQDHAFDAVDECIGGSARAQPADHRKYHRDEKVEAAQLVVMPIPRPARVDHEHDCQAKHDQHTKMAAR